MEEELNGGVDHVTGNDPAPVSAGHKMDEGLRRLADYVFRPFMWPFTRLGISPNLITLMGLAAAMLSGCLLSMERVSPAAVFFALSGMLDLADGYVAKKTDRITDFGSFLDSFSDRVSDAAIYLGLAVYYLRVGEGVYVGLALVILVTAFLISYVRARAEGFRVVCKAGLMARAPRFLVLEFGLIFNFMSPLVLKVVMWVIAALMLETLVERLIEVWKALRE